VKVKVRVRNLRKYFKLKDSLISNRRGVIKAVDGVDMDIYSGEIVGLVGESGCGKTTLGKLILHLIEPDDGEIIFDEIRITSLSRGELLPLRRRMQMIFQDPFSIFNPVYSIGSQIVEAIKFHRVVDESSIYGYIVQLLRIVGLEPEILRKYPGQLSGGQLQRSAIVRALSIQPEFLICDEIVSALDSPIQVQIIELLKVLREKFNLTILFISHDIGVIRQIADRIFVMNSGRIVESGRTDEVLSSPKDGYTQQLVNSVLSLKTMENFKDED
jgi:ABC-type oligopeptide transport system ATPase subunit